MRSGALTDTILYECINDALTYVAKRTSWGWYDREAELRLQGQYTEGTIDVTGGTVIVTLTGGTWPSWANSGDITIGNAYYRVLSVDSATQITLETAYEGPDIVAGSYRLFQDRYDLSPDLYQLNEVIYDDAWLWGPDPVPFADVVRVKALSITSDTQADLWAVSQGKLVLWPPPSQTRVVHYNYKAKPAKMVDESDVADWDPNHEDLLHRAIDYFVALKYGDDAGSKDYREALDSMIETLSYTTPNETRPKHRPSPFRRASRNRHDNRNYPNA
jgi:hypothetical protein